MKQLCILLLTTLSYGSLTGQTDRWQWGFSFGLEMTDLRVESPYPFSPGELLEFDVTNRPGYSLGITARYRLADPLYLRLGAGLLFQNSYLNFLWTDSERHQEKFELLSINMPIVLELQNDALPLNPLFFAGLTYAYQYPSRDRGVTRLPIQPHDLGVHFGLGTYLPLAGFAIRPEISYTLGLTDWLRTPDETRYRQAIRGMSRDIISLRVLVMNL